MNSGVVHLIGHGLSTLGRKWGSEIDSEPVVRLKSPAWQFANHTDYGKRLDYLVASCETMMGMLEIAKKPSCGYWAQPKKGYWNTQTESMFNQKSPDRHVKVQIELHNKWNPVFLDFHRKRNQVKECPNHSVGMAAITYICEELRPSKIRLVGFDNMLNPDLKDYHKVERGKWTTFHDWHAENDMLDVIRDEFKVEIGAW